MTLKQLTDDERCRSRARPMVLKLTAPTQ